MKQSTLIMGGITILVLAVGAFAFMNMQNKPAENKMVPPVAVESEKKAMNKTIVEIASENSDFSTLVAAVKAAGLVETLSGTGSFTVFAPTNEAFAKLPQGTVEALLKDKEKLTKILTYHVVSGKVMASDIVGLTSAKTVEGSDLTVRVDNGKVMINNANVTTTDIEASNGVIHVIDTVLLPQ